MRIIVIACALAIAVHHFSRATRWLPDLSQRRDVVAVELDARWEVRCLEGPPRPGFDVPALFAGCAGLPVVETALASIPLPGPAAGSDRDAFRWRGGDGGGRGALFRIALPQGGRAFLGRGIALVCDARGCQVPPAVDGGWQTLAAEGPAWIVSERAAAVARAWLAGAASQGYDEAAYDWDVSRGVFVTNAHGADRWIDAVTREETIDNLLTIFAALIAGAVVLWLAGRRMGLQVRAVRLRSVASELFSVLQVAGVGAGIAAVLVAALAFPGAPAALIDPAWLAPPPASRIEVRELLVASYQEACPDARDLAIEKIESCIAAGDAFRARLTRFEPPPLDEPLERFLSARPHRPQRGMPAGFQDGMGPLVVALRVPSVVLSKEWLLGDLSGEPAWRLMLGSGRMSLICLEGRCHGPHSPDATRGRVVSRLRGAAGGDLWLVLILAGATLQEVIDMNTGTSGLWPDEYAPPPLDLRSGIFFAAPGTGDSYQVAAEWLMAVRHPSLGAGLLGGIAVLAGSALLAWRLQRRWRIRCGRSPVSLVSEGQP